MNLKEAFRYQNYLRTVFVEARDSITDIRHAFNVTKVHKRHDANPGAEDMTELPKDPDYFSNDNVILFMIAIIEEKEKLCDAIVKTKNKIMEETGLSVDQATECNKLRRDAAFAINKMLKYKQSKCTDRGSAFLLNNEGNQATYYYDVEVSKDEAFDRVNAKRISRDISATADKVSGIVDQAMVNYEVYFDPMFDINDSFDESMEKFMESIAEKE